MTIEEAKAAIGKRVVITGPLTREAGEMVYASSSHAYVRVDGRAVKPEWILPAWLELEGER